MDYISLGKASLTPLTISEMWKEEEEKSKELSKHFKEMALKKGVRNSRFCLICLQQILWM